MYERWTCEHCGNVEMTGHIMRSLKSIEIPPPDYCTKCGADRPLPDRKIDQGDVLVFCEGNTVFAKCGCHYLNACPTHGMRFLRQEKTR